MARIIVAIIWTLAGILFLAVLADQKPAPPVTPAEEVESPEVTPIPLPEPEVRAIPMPPPREPVTVDTPEAPPQPEPLATTLGAPEPSPPPVAEPAPPPPPARHPHVSARLEISPTTLSFARDNFSYAAYLVNDGNCPVTLVRSIDGSNQQRRYPHVFFEVVDAAGEPCALPPYRSRCGNLNPMREEDMRRVPAGGRFDPFNPGFPCADWEAWWPAEPGIYRVRWIYDSSAPDSEWSRRGAGAIDPLWTDAAQELFEGIPHARIESNWVTLTFTE